MDRMDKMRIFVALRSHDITPEDVQFSNILLKILYPTYEVDYWDKWNMRDGALSYARSAIQSSAAVVGEFTEHSTTVTDNFDFARWKAGKPVLAIARLGGKPITRPIVEAAAMGEFPLQYYRDAEHAVELIAAFAEKKRKPVLHINMKPDHAVEKIAAT